MRWQHILAMVAACVATSSSLGTARAANVSGSCTDLRNYIQTIGVIAADGPHRGAAVWTAPNPTPIFLPQTSRHGNGACVSFSVHLGVYVNPAVEAVHWSAVGCDTCKCQAAADKWNIDIHRLEMKQHAALMLAASTTFIDRTYGPYCGREALNAYRLAHATMLVDFQTVLIPELESKLQGAYGAIETPSLNCDGCAACRAGQQPGCSCPSGQTWVGTQCVKVCTLSGIANQCGISVGSQQPIPCCDLGPAAMPRFVCAINDGKSCPIPQ